MANGLRPDHDWNSTTAPDILGNDFLIEAVANAREVAANEMSRYVKENPTRGGGAPLGNSNSKDKGAPLGNSNGVKSSTLGSLKYESVKGGVDAAAMSAAGMSDGQILERSKGLKRQRKKMDDKDPKKVKRKEAANPKLESFFSKKKAKG